MAITKIFKKDKNTRNANSEEKKNEDNVTEEKAEPKKKKELKEKLPVAWRVLKNPYISEKATALEKENKYIFEISEDANKTLVKEAIKEIYGMDAVKVNIVKVPRKRKRLGRHHGWKQGFKKAVVELKKGQKIDVFPG